MCAAILPDGGMSAALPRIVQARPAAVPFVHQGFLLPLLCSVALLSASAAARQYLLLFLCCAGYLPAIEPAAPAALPVYRARPPVALAVTVPAIPLPDQFPIAASAGSPVSAPSAPHSAQKPRVFQSAAVRPAFSPNSVPLPAALYFAAAPAALPARFLFSSAQQKASRASAASAPFVQKMFCSLPVTSAVEPGFLLPSPGSAQSPARGKEAQNCAAAYCRQS